MNTNGNPWRVRARRTVYDNPWIRVNDHDVITPGGRPGQYGVVSFKKLAIGVLPIFADGSVALVGQWRFPLEAYSWELPEGGGDLSAAPLDSAKRELREETGLTAGAWREILHMHMSNCISDEQAFCYLATGLERGVPEPDDDELLQQDRIPFREALARALAGDITDSLTVAMLLRGHHMAVSGELEPALARAMLGENKDSV